MKKILQVLCILAMALAMTFGFAACGGTRSPETNDDQEQPTPTPGQPEDPKDPEEPDKLTFTGVTFESDTIVYDGKEHSLTVTGSLPQDTAVEYTNNVGTDAGVYSASATLSAENYETLTLTATLTIQKATFPADVALESDTVVYDGEAHSLTVTGSLPKGTTVEYTNNGKTEGGEYEVTATLTNPNYQTLILKGMLYIRTLADAKAIIDDILVRPDPWSFLPEALTPEKMAYTAMPVTEFTTDTAVSAIGKRTVGKQLNVVYDILGHSQTALETADVIFTAGEAIAAAYQTFINNNPDDYSEFTGSVTVAGIGFSAKIAVQGAQSMLLLGNGTISLELRADGEANVNYGRIQITDGVTLKYQMTDTTLKFAVNAEVSAGQVATARVTQMLEFIREEGIVTGYLYEYYGVDTAIDVGVKTTSLITSDPEGYTIVTGNKRESDDLLIDAYEEVYDSETGNFIGAEVAETVNVADFDTLWFPLADVTGFRTVRVLDEANGLNADTVYVNGGSTPFATKNIGGLGLDTLSRRYDIEMKEVCYFVAASDGEGGTVYERVETLVPMLFVQNKSLADFSDDVTDENPDTVPSAALPANAIAVVTTPFTTMHETYAALKELVTYEEIAAFIGEKDSFFADET